RDPELNRAAPRVPISNLNMELEGHPLVGYHLNARRTYIVRVKTSHSVLDSDVRGKTVHRGVGIRSRAVGVRYRNARLVLVLDNHFKVPASGWTVRAVCGARATCR